MRFLRPVPATTHRRKEGARTVSIREQASELRGREGGCATAGTSGCGHRKHTPRAAVGDASVHEREEGRLGGGELRDPAQRRHLRLAQPRYLLVVARPAATHIDMCVASYCRSPLRANKRGCKRLEHVACTRVAPASVASSTCRKMASACVCCVRMDAESLFSYTMFRTTGVLFQPLPPVFSGTATVPISVGGERRDVRRPACGSRRAALGAALGVLPRGCGRVGLEAGAYPKGKSGS